jgi:N-acetylglutamate synthase/N-acetylornithine aminotransferase
MSNWTKEVTDEQKEQIWHFIVETVKEIREQIAQDIEGTNELWKVKGLNKSRRTTKAFQISAAIARGQNEI